MFGLADSAAAGCRSTFRSRKDRPLISLTGYAVVFWDDNSIEELGKGRIACRSGRQSQPRASDRAFEAGLGSGRPQPTT